MADINFKTLHPLPTNPETLIPAPSATQYTGMATQTHAKWRGEGVGPEFVKLGRRVFYTAGALRSWIKSQTRHNTIVA
jgi:hypothetical protein